jgi:basic membrane protein A
VIRRTALLAVTACSALALAACGGGTDNASAGSGGGDGEGPRIAAVFSGSTTDADYNSLGLLALKEAEKNGAEVTYSESVAVPDVERTMQEYLADGYDVIWTHGSQFYEATSKLAADNPDVTFIGEFDGEPQDQPDNVWVLDRNFHLAFYPIGVLASQLSSTGTVGYVGGLSLPFSYSEVHAMEQAIADSGASTKINPVWTGDFNDPAKAQQISTQLMSQGADVIVGSLNLGAVGTFKAAQSKPEGEAWVTAKYTDKSQFGEGHYAGSAIYDFVQPLTEVLDSIDSGKRSGYYPMGFDTGVEIQVSDAVPADVKTAVQEAVDGVIDGSVTVERNVDPIE